MTPCGFGAELRSLERKGCECFLKVREGSAWEVNPRLGHCYAPSPVLPE
jgi:hypothetical protein